MAKVQVDPLRCEGKKTCAQVCPAGVFEMVKAPTSLPITTLVKVTNLFNEDIQQHIFGDIIKRSVVGEVRFTY